MPFCAVSGCCNSNQKNAKVPPSERVSFYSFPSAEPFRSKWVDFCGRTAPINVKNARICSAHFSREDRLYNLKHNLLGYSPVHQRKVKPDAVPSMNGPKTGGRSPRSTQKADRRLVLNFLGYTMNGESNDHTKTADDSSEGNTQDVTSKDNVIFGYNDDQNETASSEPDAAQGAPQSDESSTGRPPAIYSCDSCEYSTVYPSHLKAHVLTHTGEKPYACNMCEYKTTSIANLKRHKLTHLGLKPYTCDVCGHTARSTSNLKVHMRIHSGDRPFVCDICKYSTNDTTKLKRHILKNHNDGGDTNGVSTCGGVEDCCLAKDQSQAIGPAEKTMSDTKRFNCDICLFKTRRCAEFKKHMKTHSPEKLYFCHICDYRATTPANLKIHLRVHSGEKPYGCSACPYRARTGPQLKIHMRTHTGEKPYVCKVCGHRTGQSPHLKKHIQRHHQCYPDPDEPEVADFRYVDVKTGLDDRATASGGEVFVNDDVTGGVRVKEEVMDYFDDLPMNCRADTCDVTTGDVGGPTVKEEVTDCFDEGPYDRCVDTCDVTTSDVGRLTIKQEVMDDGYPSSERQTGSNRQLMASNGVSPKCHNSDLVISDITTKNDVGGFKVKEEVVVYDYFSRDRMCV